MGHHEFGFTKKPWEEFLNLLDDVIKSLRGEGRERLELGQMEIKIAMTHAYDNKYNIRRDDSNEPPRTMPLVAWYWTEDRFHFSGLREKFGLFLNYEISKHTGLSWDEFMQHPRFETEMIIAECKKYIDRKAAETAAIINSGGQPRADAANHNTIPQT